MPAVAARALTLPAPPAELSRPMHQTALRVLEFDRIIEAVRRFALTPLGAMRLADLRPSGDPGRVQTALAATGEAIRYLEENSPFPLNAPPRLDAILDALAIEGRILEPSPLLAFAGFLASADQMRAAIRQARSPLPILRGITDNMRSFEREVSDVQQKIDPSGEVIDNASPELATIRDRLRKQRARLRSTLESYLRGKDTARYLQEQVVTDRHGRYVLVVKAEHRNAIAGIIHGSSASGASLFLEPLSTVEVNNDIVALEEQETAEVRRILRQLTEAFRGRATDLQRTLEAITELDVLQAKAQLSQLADGVEPVLSTEHRFELRAARHPLLIPQIAGLITGGSAGSQGRPGPVPIDLVIEAPTTALLITGPNTGGKTVALKTAGLLALMAQAGFHIPAHRGCRLPVFRSIFADIGDEQSISASLSTFSAHVTNIAGMDRHLALPALVLLDEVGAGTDPVEGGALGMAIIEHFRRRGGLVLATTHYDMLKSYASTTEGVSTAGFGFDPDTFAPTYRLTYGTPGRSLALEIAARIGLAAPIIEAARQYRSAREAQLADHLARVDQELKELERERRLMGAEHAEVEQLGARLQARETALREREETLKRRLDTELEERMREARREVDALIDGLRQEVARLAAEAARRSAEQGPPVSTGETGAVRAGARAALEDVAERLRGPRPAEPGPETRHVPAAAVSPGDRVAIGSLGMEGIVRAVHDRDAEVEVRGKRLRVRLDDLSLTAKNAGEGSGRISVNVHMLPREAPATELNLIGCTVDEALTRAEKFLDEAVLAEQRTVRVIHGYGTGQLRRAVAGFLEGHPFVARFGAAAPEKGGGGVTVVELKE
ncbi:MAG: endonuclease MutS2 [Acidobacteria bacterium]|nr:endonuclease MutS2 [Acidobacteriota bacterium]